MFHDLTVMKNIPVGAGGKKLQLRASCFNCLNMAFASPVVTNDIDLHLQTSCNAHVDAPNGVGGTANVCDPTQGFSYTDADQAQLRYREPAARSPGDRAGGQVQLLTHGTARAVP
jgi:hypothetical protein